MKNLRTTFVLLALSIIAVASCKKDVKELNENISANGALISPQNQQSIKLTPSVGTASQQFTWSAASPEDGGVILYEVVFAKEGGNLNNPTLRVASDGNGLQPKLTISHKDLTKIAAACGITASSKGNIIWTVVASKASNRKPMEESRMLQLERPAGFAEVPTELYLTGSATEGGDDVTKAVKMKKLEEGVFEVYTSLKPGTYQLADKPTQAARRFFPDGASIKEGATPITVTGSTKVYYLKYDFNVATVIEAVEVQSLGLYMSAYGNEIGQLAYTSGGNWESGTIPVVFYQFSWVGMNVISSPSIPQLESAISVAATSIMLVRLARERLIFI